MSLAGAISAALISTVFARGISVPGVCAALEPLGIYEQISRDLGRYLELDDASLALYDGFCLRRKKACIRLRVLDGVAYVLDMFPGYQSRHRSTLHALARVLARFGPLPNLEVTIDVTDGELQKIDLPILVITHKKEEPRGILYPDFTFYSWPESSCPPETSHDYSYLFQKFKSWHHRYAPWQNRSDLVFWRGAPVDDERAREKVVQRFQREVEKSDVKFMSWKVVSSTGLNEVQGCVGLLEQCQYRYLAFLAGTTYSSRIKYQLLCGSLVLAHEPRFIEWWSHLLLPGVHYAPVQSDWSDVSVMMELLRRQETQARRLARQGQRLAQVALSPTAVDCYWWKLLVMSAKVLPYPTDTLPPTARPLEDALLLPEDAVLSSEHGLTGGIPMHLPPKRETQDPSCFGNGRSWETCCDPYTFGALGNQDCWLHLAMEEQGILHEAALGPLPSCAFGVKNADGALPKTSAVLFDEFHERSLGNDIAFTLILHAQEARRHKGLPDLRLVAMSATLSDRLASRLSGLLGGARVVRSEGREYHVQLRHASDSRSLLRATKGFETKAELAKKVCVAATEALQWRASSNEEPGDVLCFLPGEPEIRRCQKLLEEQFSRLSRKVAKPRPTRGFGEAPASAAASQPIDVLPLHGSLDAEAQDLAVQPGEPGRRRVILATNVAEASITVSGVTSVVDSGLRKRSIFNSTTGFNRLELAAVSAASADQRRGRAGRVRDGLCLRLWAKGQKLVPEDVPAIGEEDLTGAILQLLSTGVPLQGISELPWL
ncbi:Pre-mRNA-splicing factor ATP-dependent RNA helicase DHX16 (DEAH-box protein 16), partial [Durusdinium trenchii]